MKKFFDTKKLKYIRYGAYFAIVYILILMLYVFYLMMMFDIDYPNIIVQNPVLTAFFMVALIELYIYFQCQKIIKLLMDKKEIESSFCKIVIFGIFQFIILNIPSALFMVYGLLEAYGMRVQKIDLKNKFRSFISDRYSLMMTIILLMVLIIYFWLIISFA